MNIPSGSFIPRELLSNQPASDADSNSYQLEGTFQTDANGLEQLPPPMDVVLPVESPEDFSLTFDYRGFEAVLSVEFAADGSQEAFQSLLGNSADLPLVGIIDTEFDLTNAGLADTSFYLGYDWVDNDQNPLAENPAIPSHGTQVLQAIAGDSTAAETSEVASIWLGRAVGSGEWSDSLVEFVDTATDLEKPAAIANLSFDLTEQQADGTLTPRTELTADELAALSYAQQNGVIVVVAAGNDNAPLSALAKAAGQFDNIVTVGAATADGRADYSNYGDDLTLVADIAEGDTPGTSLAAAEVTQALQTVWQQSPELNYRQVIESLTQTATDLQQPGWDADTGYGQLNLEGALAAAGQMTPESLVPAPLPEAATETLMEPMTIAATTERSLALEVATVIPADGADDIDPRAPIRIQFANEAVDASTLNRTTFQLLDDDNQIVNATVGSDSTGGVISLTPLSPLDPFTEYTVVITDDLQTTDGDAATPFSATFTTGDTSAGEGEGLRFDSQQVVAGESRFGVSSIAIGPDEQVYASDITGNIIRYNIDPATGQATGTDTVFAQDGAQIVGIAFDPDATATDLKLWITYAERVTDPNTGERDLFSSKVAQLTIPAGGGSATKQDYIVGLPNTQFLQHQANGLNFGPDGKLYQAVGGVATLGGTPNWEADESLLSSAIIVADVNSPDFPTNQTGQPVDVQTVGLESDNDPNTENYDPTASDAPVQVFATGFRNSYDLAWHSNGNLYAGINQNSLGGSIRTPADPNGPATAINAQPDEVLALVREGNYYGHPNPSRDEYVLNGGNPTSDRDQWEVSQYPVGVEPEANFDPTLFYNTGAIGGNSPNGLAEYTAEGPLNGRLLASFFTSSRTIQSFEFGSDGLVSATDALQDANGNPLRFKSPLDVAVHPNGRIYVADFGNQQGDPSDGSVWVLNPLEAPVTPPTSESGRVQFTDSSFAVDEDGTPVNAVTVERVGGTDGEVSVTVTPTADSADTPADFDASPITVTFADGDDTAQTVAIPVVDDAIAEADEIIALGLSGDSASGQTTATLTIVDNEGEPVDPPSGSDGDPFEIEAEAFESFVNYQVEDQPGVASGGQVLQNLSNNGTVASAQLAFPGPVGTYDVEVVVFDENDGESQMRVLLNGQPLSDEAVWTMDESLSGSSVTDGNRVTRVIGRDISLTSTDVITLEGTRDEGELARFDLIRFTPKGTVTPPDSESGTVQFTDSSFAVDEDGTPVNAVTVERVGGTDGEVSVTVTPTADSADTPADFDASPITVTFADGDDTPQTVAIPVVDDGDAEADEIIALGLSGDSASGQTTATLTIVDNEGEPVDPPSGSDGDPFEIEAEAFESFVNYQVEDQPGVASGGQVLQNLSNNGTVASAQLAFPGPVGTYDVEVVVFDENDGESQMRVLLNGQPLSDEAVWTMDESLSGSSVTDGNRVTRVIGRDISLTATDVITLEGTRDEGELARFDLIRFTPKGTVTPPPDSESGTVQFTDSSFAVDEDGTLVNAVTVERVGGTAGEVSVTVTPTADSADTPADFDASPITVTFADGDDTPQTVAIPVVDDGDAEADEIVQLTLTGDDAAGQTTATLTIVDDDGDSVDPPGGSTGDPFEVEAEDFDSFVNYRVETGRNAASGGQVIQNTGGEGAIGTAQLTFSGPAGLYDLEVVTFDENDGESQMRVLINGEPISNDAVWVMNEQLGSNAVSDGNRVTRLVGRDVSLTANDVITLEGTKADGEFARFDLVRFIPMGTVTPPDSESGTVQFTDSSFAVNEDGTPVNLVTLERVGGTDGAISVTVTPTADSADTPADFDASPITVTFGDGDDTPQTVAIPIVDDAIAEVDETLALGLSGEVASGQITATLTIVDNDGEPVDPPGGTPFEIEAEDFDSFDNYRVQNVRNGASGGQVIQNTGGEGAIGTAQLTFSGPAGLYDLEVVTFDENDGESQMRVLINGEPISNDAVWVMNEQLGSNAVSDGNRVTRLVGRDVSLTANDVITLEGTKADGEFARFDLVRFIPMGTVTPPDPESGTVQFTDSSFAVDEDGTPVNAVTVERVGGTDGEVSVTVTPTTDSADTPADFDASPITVTFADGDDTPQTVTIPVVDDGDAEADEIVQLTLTGDSASGQTKATLTIVDDDSDIVDPPDGSTGDPIEIEAEAFESLVNYQVEDQPGVASGGQILQNLSNNGTVASAQLAFPGPVGTYDIEVVVFDENDGESQMRVLLNGQPLSNDAVWTMDESLSGSSVTDGNRVTRVIGRDISLTATDVITLEGTRDEGELARFDLIRFTPKGTISPDPGDPPDGEDTTPPTATQLTDQLTSTAGSDEPVGIAIRYSDAGGIDLSSLDVEDITVTNGQTTLAVERFVVSPDDQTVTYFVKPPSQGWRVGDSDDYVVELVANEVADAAGNFAAAKTLGSFELTVTPEIDPDPGPSTPLGSRSVTMGGGGFVTDVHLHPAEKDLAYIRTDMGGFYRWDTGDGGHWVPLTESFPQALEQYYGGEALAFDPSNPDVVYIAAGKKLNSSQPGTILKSTDRGETWTKLDIDLRMGGNDVDRWIGERMAVDPNDSQTVLFGSRKDGLWQTTNGGEDWRKVSSLPNPGNNTGIAGILFDPNQAGLVYANSYGNGVYKSTNGGDSWSKISGSSSRVQRMSIAPDGTLYAATENHPKVTKYDPKANRWSDITPDGAWSGAKFGTISVNPHEPNELIASTGETSSPQIFFSKNGGDSWQQIKPKLNNTVPWWDDFMLRLPWISDIEFDPHVPDRVWMTNWYGTWRTDDVDDFSEPWTNFTKGHEQTVPFDMISPPDGPLLVSAMADVDGFYHEDFDTSPSRRLGSVEGTTRFSDSYSIDYAQSQPNRMARVGGNSGKQKYGLAISNDSGRTWHESDAFPSNVQPVELAFSATDPDTIVVVRKDATALYTNNGGDSWKSVQGLPTDLEGRFNWNKPLTADANGNFYYYSSGKLYRSTNDGASFSVVETNLPYDWPYKLKSPQGEANEVWLSAEDRGLYRSTNGGSDFSRISNVEKATMFSFGVPESANDFPYIYLYGTVTGQGEGTYVSKDEGKTWQDIGSPDAVIGNRPVVMEGSWQTPGLVFVGANGRGIYVGNA